MGPDEFVHLLQYKFGVKNYFVIGEIIAPFATTEE